jgi:hypothetical protein
VTAAGASTLPPLATTTADPFANSSSQHKTAVEPDSFSWGQTVVEAAQVGRFYDGGASDIGWGTSTDGGQTWTRGSLPGITKFRSGSYDRVSDPSVAYDARHGIWMIVSLPIIGPKAPAVLVNRSKDGIHWTQPVTAYSGGDLDKTWVVCDDWSHSPYYGHCYVQWDDVSHSGLMRMSTSTDGGKTWGPALATPNAAHGLAGQPLVRPNGGVIVPYISYDGNTLLWFTSTNGGASWTASQTIRRIQQSTEAGGLRSGALPSAEIDGSGKIYMVWQDCRFRPGCQSNDIVLSKLGPASSTWSFPVRVPIDPTTSTADHFIAGIAVDRATSGATAHLGLAYYFYPNTNCSFTDCALKVGFVSSTNAGQTWSAPRTISPEMRLGWLPATSAGEMVGDYISTSFLGGKAFPFFSVARKAPSLSSFNQVIQTTAGGLTP